jgi:hypothetical protein
MPPAVSSNITKAASLAAAALAGTVYLNDKYALLNDFRQLLGNADFKRRMAMRVAQLGDDTTIYHMLEIANQEEQALWFEERSWTYGGLKIGKSNTL